MLDKIFTWDSDTTEEKRKGERDVVVLIGRGTSRASWLLEEGS